MKLLSCIGVVLFASTAHANERCQRGMELAKHGDLPRAALYLDSCTDDEGVRARNDVMHKLEATKLSPMTITSLPAGATGETDAMPGEQFTTPATIWAKAGTYRITVGGQTVEKVLEPHSRTTVIINVPPPPRHAKNGVVDFDDDPETHDGPPPPVKHGTMMPSKYLQPTARSGEQIDDPFALRSSDAAVTWRLGLRASTGIADRSNASAALSVGIAALAARPLVGAVMLATRLDYAHRELDSIGLDVGLSYLAVQRASFVLSTAVALRGELRIQDTLDAMEVHRAGVGAAADLDLAVVSLPVGFGLRVEQGFTELMPGVRVRALLFELGYEWR